MLALFLCLCPILAGAETWPASREDLATENLMAAEAERFVERWARENYGEDIVILSIGHVDNPIPDYINMQKLIDGYDSLSLEVLEGSVEFSSVVYHKWPIDESHDCFNASCLFESDRSL